MSLTADAWFLDAPGKPLRRGPLPLSDPGPDEALVEVIACGMCHTDLGFADGSVPPKHPLPLVLGHEAVGLVVAAGEGVRRLQGRRVIVPAVLPCGGCEFCRFGRGNGCPSQKMPGNDVHGGFATHVLVPGAPLVSLEEAPRAIDLRSLCVVADAVSTAWQAVRRSGLAAGDVAFVVGAGGVGGFVAQIARALGARVVALDISAERLAGVAARGAIHTVEIGSRDAKDLKKEVHAVAAEWGVASLHFRIFECSGAPAGQTLAFGLLARGATMVQVGYTPKTVEVRLSNLMAFDATLHGTWGCPPEQYPAVLRLIYDGKVELDRFIEYAPMSRINTLLDDMAHHRLTRRMVLDPKT